MREKFRFPRRPTAPPPTVSGFSADTPYAQAAHQVAQAWVTGNAQAMNAFHEAHSTWFDDTRPKTRGQERGASIAQALQAHYWLQYDHSPRGLMAQLTASHF